MVWPSAPIDCANSDVSRDLPAPASPVTSAVPKPLVSHASVHVVASATELGVPPDERELTVGRERVGDGHGFAAADRPRHFVERRRARAAPSARTRRTARNDAALRAAARCCTSWVVRIWPPLARAHSRARLPSAAARARRPPRRRLRPRSRRCAPAARRPWSGSRARAGSGSRPRPRPRRSRS